MKIGLVLEGGAMRGIYTAGVLDVFMKKELYFPYVIGVSAGACQACSYISRQPGRSRQVSMKFIRDSRYLSMRNFIRKDGIFGLDFMFGEIAHTLVPFDFDAFEESEQEFVIGATNCTTGQASYFEKSRLSGEEAFHICKASSSMPLVSKEVMIYGQAYMDGGIADPIPVRKALADGCDKVVVVLTRNREYRKTPAKYSLEIAKRKYKNYTGLIQAIKNRHTVYNETLDYVERLEREGKAFIIRPLEPVMVGRMERSRKKLFAFYREGYVEAGKSWRKLNAWMKQ